jgi:hypothetical protein
VPIRNHRGQRDGEQHDDGDAGDDSEDAAHLLAGRAVDDVEADLVLLAQDEGRAPQGAPDPAQHAGLVGPAERIIEDVARRDLQDETQEHRQEQQGGDILRAPA